MAELLMIVARDQPLLYERLRREFAEDPEVTVLLDRRVTERRRASQPVAVEQRRAERRQSLVDAQLKRLGWATARAVR